MSNLISFVIVVAIIWYFFFKEEKWSIVVYPNTSDYNIEVKGGHYPTFEECASSAYNLAYNYWKTKDFDSWNKQYDYECGLNCKPREDLAGAEVCEKSKK